MFLKISCCSPLSLIKNTSMMLNNVFVIAHLMLHILGSWIELK